MASLILRGVRGLRTTSLARVGQRKLSSSTAENASLLTYSPKWVRVLGNGCEMKGGLVVGTITAAGTTVYMVNKSRRVNPRTDLKPWSERAPCILAWSVNNGGASALFV